MSDFTKPSVVFVEFKGPQKGKQGELICKEQEESPSKRIKCNTDQMYKSLYKGLEKTPVRSMNATYSKKEVSRLFEITDSRLTYWDKSGFISPSGFNGKKRCYTFCDLISIRSALTLLEKGVSLQKTRNIISQLLGVLPESSLPLNKLRIRGDSTQITVIEDQREFEAESGQILIDFAVKNFEDEIVSLLPDTMGSSSKTAYEWYLKGCDLDEDEDTLDEAEYAYHQALLKDPELIDAYINLGNLRFRCGAKEDSRALYEKALELNENCAEAHYNLGFLFFDDKQYDEAFFHFEKTTLYDPAFADAFFNLAYTLEKLGQDQKAQQHWEQYLKLEHCGAWADFARKRLQNQ